jgi:hypothetical protein
VLGMWDLRFLAVRASRSLITHRDTAAEREDIATPQQDWALSTTLAAATPSSVADRGREAGKDPGTDPAASVAELAEQSHESARS